MNVLVVFHTPINAGFAMSKLESTFYEVMLEVTGSAENIHFAFSEYNGEKSTSLPKDFNNIIEINNSKLSNNNIYQDKLDYLRSLKIDLALCFDMQVSGLAVNLLRESGVKKIASYWGSTISGINSGVKLLFKKLEVLLSWNKPDLFIFESKAMQYHATNGRGIKQADTIVIPTGVDTDILKPNELYKAHIREEFNLPIDSNIAIYSGHMERRKGVHVIINAFKHLVDELNNSSWYILICGNRPGEEDVFLDMLDGTKAMKHVLFCGYRNDLPRLMPGCDVGIIASTEWDSFPMSSLEMASCGLPMIASNLQGLTETIEDQKTGFLFEPEDYKELASRLIQFEESPELLKKMGKAARERIISSLSLELQKRRLVKTLTQLMET